MPVSIESMNLRDTAWAVLCLVCGGGGAPATVGTCRGEDAKAAAWTDAVRHADEHARRLDELRNGEHRREQGHALGWSQAQADAMLWADRSHLHFDGRSYYRKDMTDPRAGRGRTVARARVEGLIGAGFLRMSPVDGQGVELTRDGHDARRAWIAAQCDPAPREAESAHPRPLLFGEEETRRDADRAATLARFKAEEAEIAARTARLRPETPAVDPDTCDHAHAWLYLSADPVTGRLGHHLSCACGQNREAYVGTSPAMDTGTATRPRGIREADTSVTAAHADRYGYQIAGPWTVLDEHTKRSPVTPSDAEPAWTVVDDPNRRSAHRPLAELEADRCDRMAARAETLPIEGPGIIGPGTHITYRDGHGPGMRSQHGTSGTVVRIGRRSVTWQPYAAGRTLRAPLESMRVRVPRASVTVAATGPAVHWHRWSLSDHLAYARRRPGAEQPAAPQRPAREPVGQLSLWPAAQDPNRRCAAASGAEPARPVVVIPCSGAKGDRPAPAGDLYRGSLHRMCRKAADTLTATGGTTVVLSARHGLLPLDQVIAPYDVRMGEPATVTAEQLREQAVRLGLDQAPLVTVLAGRDYTAAARQIWPHAAAPLDGSRGIGQMRHRLARITAHGAWI
ncbi:DUF6884 domain-containing protein [Streptomyces sp. NPDC087850]|uniref:DUF6884 domain-containing protein n=1 Tax=Streptomyces sp. NPDC087850 TaxID=3365809 RepID=UPI0038107CD0